MQKIHDLTYDANTGYPHIPFRRMNKPLVSAIVTTKNRMGLLPRALHSVRRQTYSNMELVVVDDGSTDKTDQVIDQFNSEDISLVYIRNEESKGACRARNQGIEVASGEYITGLDDDDEWHHDRIERLIEVHSDNYACVTSDVRIVYKKGSVVWHKKKVITLDDLLFSNQVGNQVLVKKERLQKVGGFDESLEAAQDYDLWLRLCEAYGSIKNVQEPLQNVYMNHEQEQISNPKAQLAGYLAFYQKHKHKMNRAQRKYQLFNIRRAQGKAKGIADIFGWVPPKKYVKNLKRWVSENFLGE